LSEVPQLREQLFMIDTKIASRSNADDAKVLALYAGFLPGFNIHDFRQDWIA
jgi:hypothetical protein